MTRILIADDHDVVRSGLRSILQAQDDWEVVAEATNGKEAVAKALETSPDIAVLDYALPLVNGLEATRQIRKRVPRTEILIFAMHDSDTLFGELLGAGARGYLLKSDARQHLIAAIESLAAHKPYFTGKMSETLLRAFLAKDRRATDSMLTPRERSIVQLIAEGHSNKQIAGVLNVSVKTVETHRASAMRKLNLSTTAGIVRYAVRNKLVEP